MQRLTQPKNGISALELKRQQGNGNNAAWPFFYSTGEIWRLAQVSEKRLAWKKDVSPESTTPQIAVRDLCAGFLSHL